MFKIVALGLLAMVAGGFAEPPSSYLPPQSRNTPSGRYGAPFGGSQGGGKALSHHSQRSGTASFSYNSLHADDNTYKSALGGLDYSNGFAGLSQQYGAPFASDSRVGGLFASGVGSAGFGDFKISQEYGAPSFSGSENGFGTAFGSGFSSNHRFGASQQFGVPSYAAGGSSFGSPSLSFDGVGSTIGLGISGFGASHSSDASSYRSGFGSTGLGLSHQYGVPSSGASFKSHTGNSAGMTFGSAGSAHRFGVSQQYGAPGFRAGSGFGSSSSVSSNHGNKLGAYSAQFGSPSPVYGVPGSSSGADYSRATEITEPPNYEYNYEVKAADVSGVRFGHQESRELESARGSYHVLLPDGRTQVVKYEANERGYQPHIHYEEPTGYASAQGLSGPY